MDNSSNPTGLAVFNQKYSCDAINNMEVSGTLGYMGNRQRENILPKTGYEPNKASEFLEFCTYCGKNNSTIGVILGLIFFLIGLGLLSDFKILRALFQIRQPTDMIFFLPIISILFSIALGSCGGLLDDMNTNDATPVIRTHFTNDAAWKKIQKDVAATNRMGFSAHVRFIDDKQYSGLTGQELIQKFPGSSQYGCIFVADMTAMSAGEHHLLVLDPFNPQGKTFRVIPAEAWAVENNLSLANMDYSEFAGSTDPDGVFRGFK